MVILQYFILQEAHDNIYSCICSVLGTFIYDPLVEWQKQRGRDLMADTKNKDTGEVTNEEVRCSEGPRLSSFKLSLVVVITNPRPQGKR